MCATKPGHGFALVIRMSFLVAFWKAWAFSLKVFAGWRGCMMGARDIPVEIPNAIASSSHDVPSVREGLDVTGSHLGCSCHLGSKNTSASSAVHFGSQRRSSRPPCPAPCRGRRWTPSASQLAQGLQASPPRGRSRVHTVIFLRLS